MTDLPAYTPARRAEIVRTTNMDDYDSHERCEACGGRFGYGKAKLDASGRVVHAGYECTP